MSLPCEWQRAVANFLQYLPPEVNHWVIALQGPEHGRIARSVLPRLESTEIVELDTLSPSAIRELAHDRKQRSDVGFLDFSVNVGQLWDIDRRDAMSEFAHWPRGRIKRCFDVWDANFHALFAEDPGTVVRSCSVLHDAVTPRRYLEYRDDISRSSLILDCGGSTWTAYTGFEEYDYILPSGEVSCLPRSADGRLDVEGWIVGTIPFGLKYGYIRRGDLVLKFARGELTSVSGQRTELCRDLENAFDRLAGLRSIGELGIGQSNAVAHAAMLHGMACQWHERHWGIHLGLGIELPEADDHQRGGTSHHLDVVLARGQLTSDGQVILNW
jgi:hypothetical protein